MNLAGLWHNSYFTGVHPLTAWKPGMAFDDWWKRAKNDFATRERPASIATSSPPSPIYTTSTSIASQMRRPARSTIEIFAHYRDQPGCITWSPSARTSS